MEQRINLYKQIRAFYSFVFNTEHKINTSHISLYMFLLNQNNRANWVVKFKCPADTAMYGSLLSNKTYYKTLNDLVDFGLIEVEKGINNFKAPKITIKKLKYSDENDFTQQPEIQCPEQSSGVNLPVQLTQLLTQLTTLQSTQLTTQLTTLLPTLKDIQKTNYKILITYKDIKEKKSQSKKCLFRNSEYFNNIPLIEEKIGQKYIKYNIVFYYESVLNWSDSKDVIATDWLATLRGFILRDIKGNNARLKN